MVDTQITKQRYQRIINKLQNDKAHSSWELVSKFLNKNTIFLEVSLSGRCLRWRTDRIVRAWGFPTTGWHCWRAFWLFCRLQDCCHLQFESRSSVWVSAFVARQKTKPIHVKFVVLHWVWPSTAHNKYIDCPCNLPEHYFVLLWFLFYFFFN